jgi:hypothetical protein
MVSEPELPALLPGRSPVIEYGGDDVVAVILGLLVVLGQWGVVSDGWRDYEAQQGVGATEEDRTGSPSR